MDQNQPVERVVEVDRSGSGAGGWMVAVIILVIVVAGIFVWKTYGMSPAATDDTAGGIDINVTVPAGSGEEAGAAE